MGYLTWGDAIVRVLSQAKAPMHYSEIADAIAEQELRDDLGATPANSVAATIAQQLQNKVTRVSRGYYTLIPPVQPVSQVSAAQIQDEADDTGLINAFGMYWSRNLVLWNPNPKILGQQQPESKAVDFCGQRGVYLLHDGRSVVYVGRVTDQPLGVRMKQHVTDRLNGRWDRFSWFGTYAVEADGSLVQPSSSAFNHDMLVVTMEALLIEGLEPPQNRKRGDDFRAIEYLQVEDPDIRKKNIIALMDQLKEKL